MTKRLWHIAHRLATDGHFLGEYSEMVGEGEHVVKAGDCFAANVVAVGEGVGVFTSLCFSVRRRWS